MRLLGLLIVVLPLFAADRELPVLLTVGSVSEVSAHPGDSASVTVSLKVTNGFHVNANPAANEFYIPLEIVFRDTTFADVDTIRYPKGKVWRLKDSDEDLLVYDGDIKMIIPLRIPKNAKAGEYLLRGTIEYQACDDEVCFMPESRAVTVKIRIVP